MNNTEETRSVRVLRVGEQVRHVLSEILMRGDVDNADLQRLGGRPIDLVVVNLYPFEQVTASKDATLEEAIENININNPSMIRSAAKNHARVAVVQGRG